MARYNIFSLRRDHDDTFISFIFSDTMGNRGAFITLNGKDMKPYFTSYEAMVRTLIKLFIYIFY